MERDEFELRVTVDAKDIRVMDDEEEAELNDIRRSFQVSTSIF